MSNHTFFPPRHKTCQIFKTDSGLQYKKFTWVCALSQGERGATGPVGEQGTKGCYGAKGPKVRVRHCEVFPALILSSYTNHYFLFYFQGLRGLYGQEV